MMMVVMMMIVILMKRTAAACRSVARSISTRPHEGFGGSLDREPLCPPVIDVVEVVVVYNDDDDDDDDDDKMYPKEGLCRGLGAAPFAAPRLSINHHHHHHCTTNF